MHIRSTLNTDGNGYGAALIIPSYSYYPINWSTTATSGTYTFTSSRSANGAMSAASVRLISYGIVVRKVVAPLDASGMVRVRGFASKKISDVSSSVVGSTYNCDFSKDIALSNCNEVAVVGRRFDASAKLFVDPANLDTTAFPASNAGVGFGVIVISVDGGPLTSAVLDIEVFLHWEIMIPDNDSAAILQTASKPQNLLVQKASEAISSSAENVFERGVKAAADYVERYAVSALTSVSEALLFTP